MMKLWSPFCVYDEGDLVCVPGAPEVKLRVVVSRIDRMILNPVEEWSERLIPVFRERWTPAQCDLCPTFGVTFWDRPGTTYPWLVRPAKWHEGDEIETLPTGWLPFPMLGRAIRLFGDGTAEFEFQQVSDEWDVGSSVQGAPLDPMLDNPYWKLLSRRGVKVMSSPCTDCGGTGIYVGFTEKKPCPTCRDRT